MSDLTYDYFLDEVNRFREVTGSTAYTIDEMVRAFKGLAYVSMKVRSEDQQRTQQLWEVVATEWKHRFPLLLVHPKLALSRTEAQDADPV